MRVCERKKCYPVLLLLLDSWVLWIKSISFSIWSVPVHSSRGVFSGYIGELIFLFEYIRWDDSTKLIVWAYVKELKYTLVTLWGWFLLGDSFDLFSEKIPVVIPNSKFSEMDQSISIKSSANELLNDNPQIYNTQATSLACAAQLTNTGH